MQLILNQSAGGKGEHVNPSSFPSNVTVTIVDPMFKPPFK